LLSAVDS